MRFGTILAATLASISQVQAYIYDKAFADSVSQAYHQTYDRTDNKSTMTSVKPSALANLQSFSATVASPTTISLTSRKAVRYPNSPAWRQSEGTMSVYSSYLREVVSRPPAGASCSKTSTSGARRQTCKPQQTSRYHAA